MNLNLYDYYELSNDDKESRRYHDHHYLHIQRSKTTKKGQRVEQDCDKCDESVCSALQEGEGEGEGDRLDQDDVAGAAG